MEHAAEGASHDGEKSVELRFRWLPERKTISDGGYEEGIDEHADGGDSGGWRGADDAVDEVCGTANFCDDRIEVRGPFEIFIVQHTKVAI